jgi:nucleotide-binding universal stress UspA family protein
MTQPENTRPDLHPRPRNVVCGMDFSRTALAALELAVVSADGGTVHVVTAYELPLPPVPESRLMLAEVAGIETSTRRALDAVVKEHRARGAAMIGHVVTGSAVTAILDTVRETAADLVVMGTHGRTGLSRLALGSIAERVVRLSPVPVLTVPRVREGEPIGPRPVTVVLVATDFSPSADAAIEAGLALAPRGSRVHLLHVFESAVPGAREDFADSARHVRELALEREALRYEAAPVRITQRVRCGVADEEILKEAVDVQADRIVIGTAGKRGLDRLLLGSVAECVVRASRVPVLVARRFREG